jgi:hypothetical protein
VANKTEDVTSVVVVDILWMQVVVDILWMQVVVDILWKIIVASWYLYLIDIELVVIRVDTLEDEYESSLVQKNDKILVEQVDNQDD